MKKEIKGFIIGVISTILLSGGAYAAYGTISGQFNNDVTVNGVSIDGNVVIIDGAEYIKKADIISYLDALSGTEQAQSQTETTPETTGQPTPTGQPTATPQPTPTVAPTPQPTATPQPTPNMAAYNAELNALTTKYNTDVKALEDKAAADKNKLYSDWLDKYRLVQNSITGQVAFNSMIFNCGIVDAQLVKDKEARTNQYNLDVAALEEKYGI
jgi:hypothetical protein